LETLFRIRKERAEQQVLYLNSRYFNVIQGQASMDENNIKDGKNFIRAVLDNGESVEYEIPRNIER